MTSMNSLGISRGRLEGWAAGCGLMLVPKPESFDDISTAQIDDRFDGVTKVP